MNYHTLAYIHLTLIIPAFLIATWQLLRPKGTPPHRMLGRIYMVLMLITGVLTLLMPARVGARFFGHFGFIHLFSVLTLYAVPKSWLAIRRGDVRGHARGMILLYVGGLLIAGGFAFTPGRLLHSWLFGR